MRQWNYLNIVNPSGLAVHKIIFMRGCSTILIRKFKPANEHYNRARYRDMDLNSDVIEAVIAIKSHTDNHLDTSDAFR